MTFAVNFHRFRLFSSLSRHNYAHFPARRKFSHFLLSLSPRHIQLTFFIIIIISLAEYQCRLVYTFLLTNVPCRWHFSLSSQLVIAFGMKNSFLLQKLWWTLFLWLQYTKSSPLSHPHTHTPWQHTRVRGKSDKRNLSIKMFIKQVHCIYKRLSGRRSWLVMVENLCARVSVWRERCLYMYY